MTKTNDFKIYSSFVREVVWNSVEQTWRGNFIFAPFFGVGFNKVIDVRNI